MVPPDWLTLVVSIFAILGLGYLVILLVRRWWLSAAGGLFDCALRPADGGRWKLGLARYQGELLEWYLIWHPWPRPSRLFVRNDAELVALRNSDAERIAISVHVYQRPMEHCTVFVPEPGITDGYRRERRVLQTDTR